MKECLYASAGLALILIAFPALAYDRETGTILSPRERQEVVREVVLPDGRVVLQTENYGFPAFFGLGDARGKASSIPLVGGRTPSVEASTPSSGLVPGQNPE
ncbi:hypothetical protein [Aureimonas sp. SK2]|uniref:hypothetical protein n=1 Tax=Aureimonas sp. SK2 TaxID=3015992 RepID=UPI0024437A0F|nr:hypothetical protein [Aureimonas sp. SK2]